jgi:hypothetical protein
VVLVVVTGTTVAHVSLQKLLMMSPIKQFRMTAWSVQL